MKKCLNKFNNLYRVYISTINPILSILGIAAILIIFIMDMWLKTIPAFSKIFYIIGILIYTLSLTYLCSLFFYFITSHIPKQRERIIIYKRILPFLKNIIYDGKGIFEDLFKNNNDKNFSNITESDIKNICLRTNPLSDSPVLAWSGTFYLNWIQYLENKKNRKDELSKKIIINLPYLDIEFIDLLYKFDDANLFKGLHIMSKLAQEKRLANENLGYGVDKSLISYYNLIKEGEEFYNIIQNTYNL